MKSKIEKKTNLLLGLFVSSLIAANLIGTKVTHVFVDFSVGIFAYPLTFLITDVVEEVHGKKKSKEFMRVGLTCLVFVLLMTALAVYLPFAPRSFVKEEYTKVFGTTLRIFFASIVAFVISQSHDIWAFNYWKKKTKGRFLWFRNNASTIVSQFIDTTVFMFIAFYYVPLDFIPSFLNTWDKYTVGYIFKLIIPYYLLKVFVALCDTPLVYLGVRWLKGGQRK